MAAEVQVTQGYTWTEEMGIVIACLVEDEKTHLVNWVKDVSPPIFLSSELRSCAPIGTFRGYLPEETYHRGNGQS